MNVPPAFSGKRSFPIQVQGLRASDINPDDVQPSAKRGVATKSFFVREIAKTTAMIAAFQPAQEGDNSGDISRALEKLQDGLRSYRSAMAKAPDGPDLFKLVD